MRRYLIDKKEDIKELEVKEREIGFFETRSVAQTIIGPRRAGKSFSLFFWIKKKKLRDEDYIFVNFEDDEIKNMKRDEKVRCIEAHLEIYGKEPKYLFFDEIQELERWESFLYSLVEKRRYAIFVTGSTSKISSKEIASELRGRCITKVVFPLNFREYIKIMSEYHTAPLSSRKENIIKHRLKTYLNSSGFPQIVIDGLPPKLFIREYISTVVFRDLVEKYHIDSLSNARYFLGRVVAAYGNRFSINKVYNEMKSSGMKVGKGVLYNYLAYLEDLLIAFSLRKFSYSERESQVSIPKVFLCDHGLANYFMTTRFSENIGRNMENVVFIELKKESFEKDIEIFYYHDPLQQYEVDFVVKEGMEVKQLIQVCYASNFDEVEHRELRALLRAKDVLNCRNLLVITWDYEDTREIRWFGRTGKIRFVPLWKWLLNLAKA